MKTLYLYVLLGRSPLLYREWVITRSELYYRSGFGCNRVLVPDRVAHTRVYTYGGSIARKWTYRPGQATNNCNVHCIYLNPIAWPSFFICFDWLGLLHNPNRTQTIHFYIGNKLTTTWVLFLFSHRQYRVTSIHLSANSYMSIGFRWLLFNHMISELIVSC